MVSDDMREEDSTEYTVVDALYRISSLVSDVEDAQEALEIIVDEIVQIFPHSTAAIELLNSDTRRLEIEVLRGLPEHSKQMQLRLGEGVTGWVALHGQPLIVPDVRQDTRYVSVHPEVRCEMAVPMIGAGGQVVGVVNVDSRQVDAFNERDLKTLTLLTNEVTRVLSRLWFIEKLQTQADQLRALVNTGRSIVQKREIGELLRSIAEESLELMKCRVCAIFLCDAEARTLELEAIAGTPGTGDHRETLRLEDSALGTAIRRRKTIEIQDLSKTEEHHFVQLVQSLGLVSLLSSPIIVEDEVIGVLNAYTDRPHRFSNSERRVFSTLAGLSGVAIQNARLYQRIFQSEEQLRRSEKLTTLGLISAEIAHEIRNPLTVIRLLFEALGLDFAEGDPRAKDVAIIGEKLDQLEGIVSRVLSFGKAREDMWLRLDLRVVVRDTAHLMRLKLQQSGIEIVLREPEEALTVEASRGQLQQALLNLILNAMQAIEEDGRIELRVGVDEGPPGRVAVVDVIDTGAGVPEHLRGQIFDSFLSSKAEGTGLGLAIVKRILRSHQGDVQLLETGPQGTRIRIWLPAVG
ncbi:MAG: GAF domain-containing protein [Opitutales bacterium]